MAADTPAILAIARRHGLKVVEDAAHALHTERPDAFVAAVAEFLGR